MAGIAGLSDGRMSGAEAETLVRRLLSHLPDGQEPRCASANGWAVGQGGFHPWPGTLSPAASPSGRFRVVLDGHLDNWKETLNGSFPKNKEGAQALAVATLLERNGPEVIGRLKGAFSITAVDTQSRAVYLASDRFGLRPLYYTQVGERLLWASKARALCADPAVSREPDPDGVASLLHFEYVLGDCTLFKAIRVLPPAVVMTFKEGQIHWQTYWRPRYRPQPTELREAADWFTGILSQSVNRVMGLKVPVGVLLSGGIDSRTIAAAIASEHHSFQTFSFGFPWSHDRVQARRVAGILKVPHTEVGSDPGYLPRWAPVGVRATDGLVSCVHYQICQLLDKLQDVRVVFDGLAGAMYKRNVLGIQTKEVESLQEDPEAAFELLLGRWNTGVPADRLGKLLAPLGKPKIEEAPRAALEESWQLSGNFSDLLLRRMEYVELRERIRRFSLYGSVHLTSRVEVALPYLDYDLVDFWCSTLPSIFAGRRLFQELYRLHWPRLGRVMYAKTELPILPTRIEQAARWRIDHLKWGVKRLTGGRIVWRNRKASTDYSRWFRGPLAGWLKGLLLDSQAASRHLVDRSEVERLWMEHQTGQADRTAALGALATLELWCRGN